MNAFAEFWARDREHRMANGMRPHVFHHQFQDLFDLVTQSAAERAYPTYLSLLSPRSSEGPSSPEGTPLFLQLDSDDLAVRRFPIYPRDCYIRRRSAIQRVRLGMSSTTSTATPPRQAFEQSVEEVKISKMYVQHLCQRPFNRLHPHLQAFVRPYDDLNQIGNLSEQFPAENMLICASDSIQSLMAFYSLHGETERLVL